MARPLWDPRETHGSPTAKSLEHREQSVSDLASNSQLRISYTYPLIYTYWTTYGLDCCYSHFPVFTAFGGQILKFSPKEDCRGTIDYNSQ